MKYELEQTILDIKGEVAQQKYSEEVINEEGNKEQKLSSVPLTLKQAITDSVLLEMCGETSLPEDEIISRYDIYNKVTNTLEDFTQDELDIIKECISKRYVVLFAGQFLKMLNK